MMTTVKVTKKLSKILSMIASTHSTSIGRIIDEAARNYYEEEFSTAEKMISLAKEKEQTDAN